MGSNPFLGLPGAIEENEELVQRKLNFRGNKESIWPGLKIWNPKLNQCPKTDTRKQNFSPELLIRSPEKRGEKNQNGKKLQPSKQHDEG